MEKPLHSPTGASSYYRWKQCPGSVRLNHGIQGWVGPAAKKGSHVHEICEKVLKGEKPLAYYEAFEEEDVLYGARIYIDLVRRERSEARTHSNGGYIPYGIESSFDMSERIGEGLYGTTDFWIYRNDLRRLIVIDYKNGKQKVEAERNDQLLFYALGAALQLKEPISEIELVICQPNAGGEPIRRWVMDVTDLFDFVADLKSDLARTKDPNAELKMGSWCFFCAAVFVCPLKRAERVEKAKEEFSDE